MNPKPEKESPIDRMEGIEVLEGVQLFPDIQTILVMDSAADFREDYDLKAIDCGGYKVMPWGADNLLPNHLMQKIESNDVVSANLKFNRDVCYGLGPKIVRAVEKDSSGVVRRWDEVTDGPEFEFFERNDIPMFILQQLTDMNTFYNIWAEVSFAKGKRLIESVRHREAVFSRWSEMDPSGDIPMHFYCAKWDKNPTKKDIIATRAINEMNPLPDLESYSGRKQPLMWCAYMPSPGHPYYSAPEWHSIFRSGWFDHSCMVPKLKTAILKNQLGVKYIIYISPKYFENLCKREGITINDRKAYKERIEQEKKKFSEFLSGENNASKTIMAMKDILPSASGSALEMKDIEIVPVPNDLKGGEYIDDTESTANIICYAMGVHSSLIGATPGKNSNSLSGSNARELYMMQQALKKPIVDRCMRLLKIVKQFNHWDPDIYITIPEYIFTTLDQNKTGKEESTNTKA